MLKTTLVSSIILASTTLTSACGASSSDVNQASAGSTNAGNTAGSNSAAGSSTSGSDANGAGAGQASGGNASAGSNGAPPSSEKFSFFVTSLKAMRDLSGSSDGFGGDLHFGETGTGAGLRGADKICTAVAERSMPGNGKTWRAFLSATAGEDGKPVNAIDRIGEGPWYDRTGRLLAQNKTDLATERPTGADTAIVNDLPNEDGVPNHAPDASGEVDNHDVLTGTGDKGQLFSNDASSTCKDWTSAVGSDGKPHCGHSWPRAGGGGRPGGGGGMMGSGNNWMSALNEAGCAPGAFVIEKGPPGANGTLSVGDGGGYGGIYCFALTP